MMTSEPRCGQSRRADYNSCSDYGRRQMLGSEEDVAAIRHLAAIRS